MTSSAIIDPRLQGDILSAISADYLALAIYTTERCNFRCTYCYESFAHGAMKEQVIRGVENLIAARAPTLRILTISWFGGEPLLAKHVLFRLSHHVARLRERHGFGFAGAITTNGWFLTREVFEQLTMLGTRDIQLSLDGDRGSAVRHSPRGLARHQAKTRGLRSLSVLRGEAEFLRHSCRWSCAKNAPSHSKAISTLSDD
jgi:sulfatase maturation enzyme AslB (radical SAM superfamily)